MIKILPFMALLVVLVIPGHMHAATIVDLLGEATPDTTFPFESINGGLSITPGQHVGPRFTLTEPMILTEVGGFVCPIFSESPPFMVHIRPSINGVPDPSTVLGTFVLSAEGDPSLCVYESVAMHFRLEPGTYFALFAPQGDAEAFLLSSGPMYAAGFGVFGFLDPITGASSAFEAFGAARILGTPILDHIEVSIDIKPGSFPNSINPKSNGVIPVAILTTETFDATTIDPLSVKFGSSGATEVHGKGHIEDVNQDGEPDLVLHFKTQATGIQCGDTSASLTGETFDNDPIEGSDSIKTEGCKK